MIHAKPAVKEKKRMNSNTILLLLTIGLFVVMYAAGCIAYADKGFTKLQTFLDILKNNAAGRKPNQLKRRVRESLLREHMTRQERDTRRAGLPDEDTEREQKRDTDETLHGTFS